MPRVLTPVLIALPAMSTAQQLLVPSSVLYDVEPAAPVIAAGVAAALACVLSLPRLTPRVPQSAA